MIQPSLFESRYSYFNQSVPVASFAASVLSSKDHPSLVISVLQLVDLLLGKLPQLFKPTFRREGVFHEIDSLGARTLSQSPKSKDKDKDSPSAPDSGNVTPAPAIHPSTIPGYRKLSSLSIEPEDAITLRARVIQFRYLKIEEEKDDDDAFGTLHRLNERIALPNANEKELGEALRELADLFASPHASVSSFELMQSGVVDGLLKMLTDQGRTGKCRSDFVLLGDSLRTQFQPTSARSSCSMFSLPVKPSTCLVVKLHLQLW